jgi:hypothetical protein
MKRITPLLALFVVLAFTGVASACPMCKESISDTPAAAGPGGPNGMGGGTGLPTGFNYSVYILLGGFLGTLGLVTGVIIRTVRATPATGGRGFPVTPDAATETAPARLDPKA